MAGHARAYGEQALHIGENYPGGNFWPAGNQRSVGLIRSTVIVKERLEMETTCHERSVLKYILAGLVVTACSFIAVGRAHAYGTLTVKYAEVDTSNCELLGGNLRVIEHSDSCEVPDSIDGTFFDKDQDGIALKVVLSDSNGIVAKVEFHPFGEQLWVYDTRNDGDSIYVQLRGPSGVATYGVTGTSDTVDYNVYDLNFAELTYLEIDITDDADGTHGFFYGFGMA
jgi:hypothetical protein